MSAMIETVRAGGFSMDCFRFGHGEKPLVILPGLSVDSVMKYADAVADAYSLLAEDFTVCLLDRRKELPARYSVYEMAEDTAEAIRALGFEQINLFGVSQGGMIAMMIAARHPDLVSRLVLGSTSACVKQEEYRTIENWIRFAKAGDAKGLYQAFGKAIYPPETYEQLRDLLAAAAGTVTGEDLRRFVILAEGIKGFDAADRLRAVSCPALVLGSADDSVLGSDASEQIAELLKGHTDCELYVYHGYGHAAYDLAPDYKERILRFLTAGQVQKKRKGLS